MNIIYRDKVWYYRASLSLYLVAVIWGIGILVPVLISGFASNQMAWWTKGVGGHPGDFLMLCNYWTKSAAFDIANFSLAGCLASALLVGFLAGIPIASPLEMKRYMFKMRLMNRLWGFLLQELRAWGGEALSSLPGGTGVIARRYYWQKRFEKCGHKLWVGQRVTITRPKNMAIGEDVAISAGCRLSAGNGARLKIGNNCAIGENTQISGSVKLGNDCLVASNVVLVAGTHNYGRANISIRNQGSKRGAISVGDNVWVCTGAIILRNVSIGDNCIIGAGAVVTHDVAENTIVGGVPARLIKQRGQIIL